MSVCARSLGVAAMIPLAFECFIAGRTGPGLRRQLPCSFSSHGWAVHATFVLRVLMLRRERETGAHCTPPLFWRQSLQTWQMQVRLSNLRSMVLRLVDEVVKRLVGPGLALAWLTGWNAT